MKNKMLLVLLVGMAIAVIMGTAAQTNSPKLPAALLYKADGTPVTNSHIVIGSINVPPDWVQDIRSPHFLNGIPVTLAGGATFSSADSYMCFAPQLAGRSPLVGTFRKVDGRHFAIRVPGAGRAYDQDFFCIGN